MVDSVVEHYDFEFAACKYRSYNEQLVDAQFSAANDATPVDRARTLTASAPQAIWRTNFRYRVNKQSKSGHSNFDRGDIGW